MNRAKKSQFRGDEAICAFLEEMNVRAKELGLKGSFFDSPHGLNNLWNRSSANDICKLSCISMRNPVFRKVVSTKRYVVQQGKNSK